MFPHMIQEGIIVTEGRVFEVDKCFFPEWSWRLQTSSPHLPFTLTRLQLPVRLAFCHDYQRISVSNTWKNKQVGIKANVALCGSFYFVFRCFFRRFRGEEQNPTCCCGRGGVKFFWLLFSWKAEKRFSLAWLTGPMRNLRRFQRPRISCMYVFLLVFLLVCISSSMYFLYVVCPS